MKLEAVSVCVNYSDFFCWTVKENKHIFDKWVVVTDTKDKETAALCNEHGITCVQTDIFYEGGGFNKYAGINEGLKQLSKDGWVLFLDVDIALPHITKRVLNELNLNKQTLYGIDRVDCTGLSNWIRYSNKPNMIFDNWLLTTGNFKLGARIVHYYGQQGDNGKFGGYKPLGFFQLVHSSSFTDYPQNSLGADHCDIVFANAYTRDNRQLIPEIIGIHLESPNSKWGDNWYGRKSSPFGDVLDQEQVSQVVAETKQEVFKEYKLNEPQALLQSSKLSTKDKVIVGLSSMIFISWLVKFLFF